MLNSKDIREIKFSKSVGGYKQEEVDVLLDKVEADYELYERTVRELQNTVETLKREIEGYKNSQNSIQNVLLSAQKLADQIVDEARVKSDKIVREAQENVDRISREEQELSATFEEKANLRRTKMERELEAARKDAETKKAGIEAATADAVKRQQMLFDKLRLEVVAFKTEIRQKYKEHLELLQGLPDEVPMDPKEIAAAVSAAISQAPDPSAFVPQPTVPTAPPAPPVPEDGFSVTDIEPEQNEEDDS